MSGRSALPVSEEWPGVIPAPLVTAKRFVPVLYLCFLLCEMGDYSTSQEPTGALFMGYSVDMLPGLPPEHAQPHAAKPENKVVHPPLSVCQQTCLRAVPGMCPGLL